MRARQALHENARAPVGQFQHAHDDGDRADAIEVVARRFFLVEVALRGEQDHAVLAERFVNRADGFLARDKERHDHKRVNNDVAKREHRQRLRNL
jgi:hypothetical protein